ncbi:hypothetical protein SteCoe_15734 [Stentor coeruleus]|uniref:Uncharacterized protein n=1 Tax=Stentor coeruleus TaxID=5963 RepID=A0A1R2C327_9CILI|nr:hypothetical protein SteCoe_15734 [Stentor coeruleus]
MEKSSDNIHSAITRKKNTEKLLKVKKKIKLFLRHEQSGLSNKIKNLKSYKKNDPTPSKTRASVNKENLHKKDSISFFNISSSKLKITRQNTSKKKIEKPKISKNHYPRGHSLCDTTKKPKTKVFQKNLNPNISQNNIKSIDQNNKTTPRSTHPSPQYSHRTPDNIKFFQMQNLAIMTEKKSKIPEVGYYCKRFSLFDRNKGIESGLQNQTFAIMSDYTEDHCENPFNLVDEDIKFKKNDGISAITRTLKLESSSQSPSYNSPDKPRKIDKVLKKSPEAQSAHILGRSPDKVYESPKSSICSPNSIKKTNDPEAKTTDTFLQNSEDIYDNTPPRIDMKNVFSKESFSSPTRIIQVYNSPETRDCEKTPESVGKKYKETEPKAPRKPFNDYDSPGSFVFSISSNTSDEKIMEFCDGGTKECQGFEGCAKKKPFSLEYKDEEIQTDLPEIITDNNILEGLKIIGKLSEIMNLKNN